MSEAERDPERARAADETKRRQWDGFIRKIGAMGSVPPFEEVVRSVRVFLGPV